MLGRSLAEDTEELTMLARAGCRYPETDGVTQFTPHTATINVLAFDPVAPSRLYSTSYDGTVRCLDLAHERFDLTYATPAATDGDHWLQHSCVSGDGRLLLLGDSLGFVTGVDLRTNAAVWQADCCEKKVQTVCLNPAEDHYLAAASLDRTVRIFDLRKLPGGAAKAGCGAGAAFEAPAFPAVATFTDSNSVNCAYWNPTGTTLVSVTQSNFLHLYNRPQAMSGGAFALLA